MNPDRSPFAISIIVEWENAERIGDNRAREMLRVLHEQVTKADQSQIASIELIITYAEGADSTKIDLAVAEAGGGVPWNATVRHAPAPSNGYYDLKNYGNSLASGDILILLDSDVVPQPGWLNGLVATFREPKASVVCGATWIDYGGIYSSAMALGWIFPLRPEDDFVVPASGFSANNVAFRAHLSSAMLFPTTSQYRGQGVAVIERLRAEGLNILINRGAQVTHPPPAGIKGFVTRALWSGYDLSIRSKVHRQALFWRGARNIARTGAAAIFSVATQFRKVNLGVLEAFGAAIIVGTYHALRGAGFLTALVAPNPLHRALTRVAP